MVKPYEAVAIARMAYSPQAPRPQTS